MSPLQAAFPSFPILSLLPNPHNHHYLPHFPSNNRKHPSLPSTNPLFPLTQPRIFSFVHFPLFSILLSLPLTQSFPSPHVFHPSYLPIPISPLISPRSVPISPLSPRPNQVRGLIKREGVQDIIRSLVPSSKTTDDDASLRGKRGEGRGGTGI